LNVLTNMGPTSLFNIRDILLDVSSFPSDSLAGLQVGWGQSSLPFLNEGLGSLAEIWFSCLDLHLTSVINLFPYNGLCVSTADKRAHLSYKKFRKKSSNKECTKHYCGYDDKIPDQLSPYHFLFVHRLTFPYARYFSTPGPSWSCRRPGGSPPRTPCRIWSWCPTARGNRLC